MIFSTDIKIIGTTPMCPYLYIFKCMKYFEYTKEKIVCIYMSYVRERDEKHDIGIVKERIY